MATWKLATRRPPRDELLEAIEDALNVALTADMGQPTGSVPEAHDSATILLALGRLVKDGNLRKLATLRRRVEELTDVEDPANRPTPAQMKATLLTGVAKAAHERWSLRTLAVFLARKIALTYPVGVPAFLPPVLREDEPRPRDPRRDAVEEAIRTVVTLDARASTRVIAADPRRTVEAALLALRVPLAVRRSFFAAERQKKRRRKRSV